eukprot:TRINITY_DN24016_c0_g1_i1.p2 TRINITY_DN24016_c0_g1~~TRINITY_DN24016_c0_g1_i1.p2  ORF type:complete len:103 (-),score=7.86 TRINITY_DN24016_c0_g1_i1:157-465(-)
MFRHTRVVVRSVLGPRYALPRKFYATEREERIAQLLRTSLKTNDVQVTDISGGCGAMFNIAVTSPLFAGKSMVQQHRDVNAILKDEIKDMHGLTLKTKASSS